MHSIKVPVMSTTLLPPSLCSQHGVYNVIAQTDLLPYYQKPSCRIFLCCFTEDEETYASRAVYHLPVHRPRPSGSCPSVVLSYL